MRVWCYNFSRRHRVTIDFRSAVAAEAKLPDPIVSAVVFSQRNGIVSRRAVSPREVGDYPSPHVPRVVSCFEAASKFIQRSCASYQLAVSKLYQCLRGFELTIISRFLILSLDDSSIFRVIERGWEKQKTTEKTVFIGVGCLYRVNSINSISFLQYELLLNLTLFLPLIRRTVTRGMWSFKL